MTCRLLVNTWPNFLSSVRRRRRGKPRLLPLSLLFQGFPPSMPVPLCNLLFPVGLSVITTTSSSTTCAVTYSAATPVIPAAPFVPPLDATPLEPSHKCCREDSSLSLERLEMLTNFEIWTAYKRSFGHSSDRQGP